MKWVLLIMLYNSDGYVTVVENIPMEDLSLCSSAKMQLEEYYGGSKVNYICVKTSLYP